MKPRSQVLLTVAVALIVFAFHLRWKRDPDYQAINELAEQSGRPREWIGKVPPQIDLPTIDGKRFKLSEHVGREVVILNFFATWCAPCRAEMPELERFYTAHAGAHQPVTLVGIDAYEQPNLVTRYRSDMKLTFPIVIADQDLVKQFGVNSFPTTVVIAPDGTVQLYELSAIANADVTLEPVVKQGLPVIARNAGITADQFMTRSAAEQRPTLVRTGEDDVTPKLTGHALQIASTMNCVCGCSDKVSVCKCSTARKMRERLQKEDFGKKTDAEIKTELNAEYCMKSGM